MDNELNFRNFLEKSVIQGGKDLIMDLLILNLFFQ